MSKQNPPATVEKPSQPSGEKSTAKSLSWTSIGKSLIAGGVAGGLYVTTRPQTFSMHKAMPLTATPVWLHPLQQLTVALYAAPEQL